MSQVLNRRLLSCVVAALPVPITRPGIWFICFTIEKKASGEEALKCDNLRYKSALVFQVWDNKKRGKCGSNCQCDGSCRNKE